MDRTTRQAERIIAVLSPDSLSSAFFFPPWAAAFARNPTGSQSMLIPTCVRPCDVEGVLGQIVVVDLVDRTEQEAQDPLLAAARRQRGKPGEQPTYPFSPSHPKPGRFPGAPSTRKRLRGSASKSSHHMAPANDPDWNRMLRYLCRACQELLDQSFYGIAWMELGLSSHPNLVRHATNLLFCPPDGDERLLPLGTNILNTYDEAEP